MIASINAPSFATTNNSSSFANFSIASKITALDFRSNQLTRLPDSIGQLTQLTELDLHNNSLTTLPDSIGQLTQLTELDLSFNLPLKLQGVVCELNRSEIEIKATLVTSPSEIEYLDSKRLEIVCDWFDNDQSK
ncbi:leucine-rich repeat domain-containing protein [Agarivorans aestuarii]|uniref:leucine-rich repeat domain-containing protein n=1 Tax=Agarivorans aestuarii TaxID=1563703 RepID=UPI003AF361E7